MKHRLILASILSIIAGQSKAESINLTGGDISYTYYTQTSSSQNARVKGAALNSDTAICISEADSIIFSNNLTQNSYTSSHTTVDADLAAGGAIHGGTVTLSNNKGDINFSENALRAKTSNDARTRVRGGAIKGGTVSICNNESSSITFTGNKAVDEYKAWDSTVGAQTDQPRFSCGGAVYANTTLTISGNRESQISFSNNEAGKGGAVSAGYGSAITISDNGTIRFSNNTAENGGSVYTGAYIYLNNSNTPGNAELSITGNNEVIFSNNRARNNGGAIYNQKNSSVRINNNKGNVSFTGNSATLYGGAIRGQSSSTVEINRNQGTVSLSDNHISRTDISNVYGGAVSLDTGSTLSINNNAGVQLNNNTAQTNSSAYGGAIALYNSSMDINENTGEVNISGNKVIATKTSSWESGVSAEGGAIYGKTLNIKNNTGTILIQNNTARTVNNGTAKGGAIYVQDTLSITGNAGVVFRGNVQQDSTQTILRSVYVDSKSTTGALNLSAATGGSITFYDSLYAAASSNTYTLSADFNGVEGQTGTIIFSGKHAESDLLAVKENASTEEKTASRTSTIAANVNLHRGILSLEDGAILQSQGMQLSADATLNLYNGMLDMQAETSLNLSGMLSVEGVNSISAASVNVANGANLTLRLSADNLVSNGVLRSTLPTQALLTLNTDTIHSSGTQAIDFLGLSTLNNGKYAVLNLSDSGLDASYLNLTEGITVTGLSNGDFFSWDETGTILYLNHTLNVPEPTTTVMLLLSMLGLAARRRRK